MNKYVMLAGAALCLSTAACNDGRSNGQYSNANGYNGSTQYADASGAGSTRAERKEEKDRFWFERIDRDHKGYITKADLRTHLDHVFRKMDANGDGKVTYEEFMDFKHREVQEFMEHHHKHHDDMNNDMTDGRNSNY